MEQEHRNGHAPLDSSLAENGHASLNGFALQNGAGFNQSALDGKATEEPLANKVHDASNVHATVGHGSAATSGSAVSGNAVPEDVVPVEATQRDSDLDEADDECLADVDQPEDDVRVPRKTATAAETRQLQHVGEARRRQGLSVRCVAQRLGLTVSEVRAQEEGDADMLLSELYRWQAVLDVPLEELLADPQDELSPRVLMRARMLRVMKTARALRAQARSESEHRLAKVLIGQLIEIMPELKEVAAWPTVGHRRTADEVGRIGERTIPDDFMYEAS